MRTGEDGDDLAIMVELVSCIDHLMSANDVAKAVLVEKVICRRLCKEEPSASFGIVVKTRLFTASFASKVTNLLDLYGFNWIGPENLSVGKVNQSEFAFHFLILFTYFPNSRCIFLGISNDIWKSTEKVNFAHRTRNTSMSTEDLFIDNSRKWE